MIFKYFYLDFNIIKVIINIVEGNRRKINTMNQKPQWLFALDEEDIEFLKNFVLHSGSLKEMANVYDSSYPTIRLKLDRLIQKIQLNDKEDPETFQTFIRGLALDEKVDIETAKLIISKHEESVRDEVS